MRHVTDDIVQLHLMPDVEKTRRFVEQQQAWLLCQRTREHNALPFSRRKLVNRARCEVQSPAGFERFACEPQIRIGLEGETGEFRILVYYWDGDMARPTPGKLLGKGSDFLYSPNPRGDLILLADEMIEFELKE